MSAEQNRFKLGNAPLVGSEDMQCKAWELT
jgi:hypothetical protein